MQIVEIDHIDATAEPFDWTFPQEYREEIEAYWQKEAANRIGFFNGTVLIQHRGEVEGRVFRAGYSATEYKHFLGFLRLPHLSPGIRNGFGMAALRARDGAFLLGEMGPNTANAGRIYFAAGTPDLGDIRDGRVDLASSVLREMEEETGLKASEVVAQNSWTAFLLEKRVAFMRDVFIDLPAEEARRLMLDRMKNLHEEELSDIVIIRPGDPLPYDADDPFDRSRMPSFVAEYMKREFARR